jgi:acetate kinase
MRDSLRDLSARDVQLDAIAVRVPFGGQTFRGPTFVDEGVLARLEKMIPSSPLHLPHVMDLLVECRSAFGPVPQLLFFETAFFTHLPRREYVYGVDRDLARALHLRRFGFHGLYHEAACEDVVRLRLLHGIQGPARILSICLEPHPEVAAVMGGRPVYCTSGATPLEGIPGHTSCGELDPSIVLTLAHKLHWGPEQVNALLTRESGLLGLTGKRISIEDLFLSFDPALEAARAILQHRLLQACGAAIAAMGGIDSIVFSGRFVTAGESLGPWLETRLTFRGGNESRPPTWHCFKEPLGRIIADRAVATLLQQKAVKTA